jgi:hypothetical protein
VGNTVLPADAIEDVRPILRRRAGAFVGTVGIRDAIIGQHAVKFVGEDGDRAAQKGCAGQHRGAGMQLDVGELRDTIDSEEHMHVAFGATQIADIDVNVAYCGLGKAPALGCGFLVAWQSRDPMPRKAEMERAAEELGMLSRRQPSTSSSRSKVRRPELDDDRFFDLGQHRALRLARSHRPVSCRGALAALRHRLGIQAVADGRGSGAFCRCLELGSNTRRRSRCAVKTCCQRASSSNGSRRHHYSPGLNT